jgi:hypothetical protein
MNKEYQHSEMIEAYLRNELSAAEKADFEQLVRQDPLLYNEFLLQKEIVSGLQSYRKAQLKNRLNQVDVSNTSSWSGAGSATAWIGGLVLVGLLSWFGYSYLNNKAEDTMAVAETNVPVTANANTHETPAVAENPVESATTQNAESSVSSAATSEMTVSTKPAKASVKASRTKPQASDNIAHVIPANEMAPGSQEESLKKADAEPVTDKLPVYGNTSPAANRLNVIDNTNESLKLHYYYRNGRIALLGFEKPYTFLDMPSENITYLYYEGNYYKLNVSQIQPAPIQNVLVTDQALIDSLNKMLTERK